MFKCQTCKAYRDEIKYLKAIIGSLMDRCDMTPPDISGPLMEDFKEPESAELNEDGHPAPDIHDE